MTRARSKGFFPGERDIPTPMELPKEIAGIQRFGLIAGKGELPVAHAEKVRRMGLDLVAIALDKSSGAALEPFCSRVVHLGIGQVGKILETLKRENVRGVTLLGKVDKRLIFNRPRLDLRAIRILTRSKNHEDHSLMETIVRELETEGIRVLDQSLFLEDLFAPKGPISDRVPSGREREDVEYGIPLARQIAGLNIGQTLVVKDRMVVAVEAAEGTDETIRRAGQCGAREFVVIKMAKKGQDPRFDVPTVGPGTLRIIGKNGGTVLAVEAGKTLLVDREEALSVAKKHKISILGV